MPTAIPYLDEAWQPVTGCTPCSPGCQNCYACGTAASPRCRDHRRYAGLTTPEGKWNGTVRCNEEDLDQPLRWRNPKTVGVCFMGDLFHEDVPDAFLDKVFAVMALCPQHTFVLCTKRAERMREYLTSASRPAAICCEEEVFRSTIGAKRSVAPWALSPFPPPNAHFGVTVESWEQHERINIPRDTPAAHRWISYEPALGELTMPDFVGVCPSCHGQTEPGDGHGGCDTCRGGGEVRQIDGLIVGCESGPNRRPFDLDWARQVRDDCEAAGVKFYLKQAIVDGRFTKDVGDFPKDLQIQQLSWPIGKRGA